MATANPSKATIKTQIESLLEYLSGLYESIEHDAEENLVMKKSQGVTRFFKRGSRESIYISVSQKEMRYHAMPRKDISGN